MKEQLSITERDRLRVEIIRGALDRDDLQAMALHPHDQWALSLYLPTAQKHGRHVPDRLAQIAASLTDRLSGSDLLDPVGYLLHGNLASIAALIDADDLAFVERCRTRRKTDNQRTPRERQEEEQ
jgi:hypothetical protein